MSESSLCYFLPPFCLSTVQCSSRRRKRVIAYRHPEPVQLPPCPGYAGQTWHDNAQKVTDFHLTGWSAALTHFSLVQGELGLQSSMGSYPCFHHPAVSLLHSGATPAGEQPTDMSLQPAGFESHVLSLIHILDPIYRFVYALTSMTGSWLYSFSSSRTSQSPIAPRASPTTTQTHKQHC